MNKSTERKANQLCDKVESHMNNGEFTIVTPLYKITGHANDNDLDLTLESSYEIDTQSLFLFIGHLCNLMTIRDIDVTCRDIEDKVSRRVTRIQSTDCWYELV